MINRQLEARIIEKVNSGKVIVLLGPRQVGKTTLINLISKRLSESFLYVNGDDPGIRLIWNNPSLVLIKNLLKDKSVVFFDEAQHFENIGLTLKIIKDAGLDIQVFATGSSALSMANSINEPLTGRKWEFKLYPISWEEAVNYFSLGTCLQKLEDFLVTGMYPEIIMNPDESVELLSNVAGSYLYKDILELGGIRKPELLTKLLQALAWQVGQEVSYNELARTIGADKATVSSYIDLLEKNFVIFKLQPYARNLRNEISTKRKIYFYDNGVLNTLINNYAPIQQRNDIGALWENFLISERKKQLSYRVFYGNMYYWRNTLQREIDYLEEENGEISIFEFKWNVKRKVKFPQAFMDAYQPVEKRVITRENFWTWLQSEPE